jgi:hypothetical protein
MAEPYSAGELENLIARLERALHETAAGFKRGTIWVSALFFVIALAFAVQGAWFGGAFSAAFGIAMVGLGRVAVRKNSPEKMRPVVVAVREAPETIVVLRHYQTADSRRVFVTDWIEIKTANHRMVVKAKKEWQSLLATLERRCPNAKVTR